MDVDLLGTNNRNNSSNLCILQNTLDLFLVKPIISMGGFCGVTKKPQQNSMKNNVEENASNQNGQSGNYKQENDNVYIHYENMCTVV